MRNLSYLFIFSLFIANQTTIDFQPDLNISGQKIVDEKSRDSEYDFPFQNFLLAVEENQEIIVDVEILSKRIVSNSSDILDSFNLSEYSKRTALSSDNDLLTYYILNFLSNNMNYIFEK